MAYFSYHKLQREFPKKKKVELQSASFWPAVSAINTDHG